MAGVNKVILIGNLGDDPEVRYTGDQRAVANLRLATTRAWRDKQSNELSSNQAPRTPGCAACRCHRDKKCHFKKMILKHRNPKCSQIRNPNCSLIRHTHRQ